MMLLWLGFYGSLLPCPSLYSNLTLQSRYSYQSFCGISRNALVRRPMYRGCRFRSPIGRPGAATDRSYVSGLPSCRARVTPALQSLGLVAKQPDVSHRAARST